MAASTREKDKERRERYRTHILQHTGMGMSPMFRPDEISRMRTYITTMEQFFKDSCQAELDSLEPRMASLSPEDKDEFLQYHYPVHWEENFGSPTRIAFCTILCSHVEVALADIANRIEVIQRCEPMSRRDKLSTMMRYKSYFETTGNFSGPPAQIWSKVDFIYWMRNAFIHNDGTSNKIGNYPDFDAFLKQLPNVAVHGDFIELRSGSCSALLDIAENFLALLHAEYRSYQSRMRAAEPVLTEATALGRLSGSLPIAGAL